MFNPLFVCFDCCPSVFVLKPDQSIHINKGRLHAFRKLASTALCPTDCHSKLRTDVQVQHNLGSKEYLCVSVAWDWMFRGYTSAGIRKEV